MPNINVFNLLRDKFRLNEYCECNNVSAPKFYDIKEIPLLGEEKYPLLLKPCIGSGSRGLIRLFSKSDFTKEVEEKIRTNFGQAFEKSLGDEVEDDEETFVGLEDENEIKTVLDFMEGKLDLPY